MLTIKVHRLDAAIDGIPKVQVIAASLHGVSQPIADHLREMELRDVPMPIMLDVDGTIQARITRDAAGVVRVTAKRGRGDSLPLKGDPEAQSILAGQRLLDAVLAKTLEMWGVTRVTTDDGKEA